MTVVAEDSGLVIPALGGDPGVHSARFLGAGVSYPVRFAEIFRRLATAGGSRHAQFATALCVARGDEILFEVETSIGGEIATAPAGEHGFGYDPIFFYAPLGKTTGELTIAEKSAVSHRARAFRDFAGWYKRTAIQPRRHDVRLCPELRGVISGPFEEGPWRCSGDLRTRGCHKRRLTDGGSPSVEEHVHEGRRTQDGQQLRPRLVWRDLFDAQ